MEALTLRYKLEADELAEAAYEHSPTARSSARRTKALGLVGIVVGAASITTTPAGLAALGVGALIFGLGTRFSITRRTRWVFERTPFLADPVTAVADEHGIRFTTPQSDLWYRWSNYAAVRDAAEGIALIMRGGTTVRWIPSRAFADRTQQAAWAAEAARSIGSSPAHP